MTLAVLFQALLVGSAALAAGWLAGAVGRRAAARVGLLPPRPAPALHRAATPWDGIDLVSIGLATADVVAVALSVIGAFVLRLDWTFGRSPELAAAFGFTLLAAEAIKPTIFVAFGLYRRYWRYAGSRDVLVLAFAASTAGVALAGAVTIGVLIGVVPHVPRSILAIDWLLTLACVAGLRLSIRAASGRRPSPASERHPAGPRRVLVAGAGDTGALVIREMQRSPTLALEPVGLLDNHPATRGKRIHEVPVLGALGDLDAVVVAHDVDEVVIAMPTAAGSVIRTIVDSCRRVGVPSRSVPSLFELLDGGVSVSRLREIEIADLLRRAPVPVRPDAGLYLQDQVVLITGAGGSIGSELCGQVARARASDVVLLGHGENTIFDTLHRVRDAHPHVRFHTVIADVRHPARMRSVLGRYRPAVVFHAAAHKHVPMMEAQPDEAIANNVQGTLSLVDAALATGVRRFVVISTDKAVAPSSVMGATKRVAEMIVRDAARTHRRAFSVVRFGNVLGSRGSVVPIFTKQIQQGGPITITHPDMTRFFMTIPEAVYLVLKAGGLAVGGELFVLNMGEPVRIVDLTRDLIRLSGLRGDEIPIVYTGLRPGEKLDEALWEPGATREPVGDDDVLRVVEPGEALSGAALQSRVSELLAAADRGDAAIIRGLLQDIVPTYRPALRVEPEAARSAPASLGSAL